MVISLIYTGMGGTLDNSFSVNRLLCTFKWDGSLTTGLMNLGPHRVGKAAQIIRI